MDDNGIQLETGLDVLAGLEQRFGCRFGSRIVEYFSDGTSFLFIQTQDHIKMLLELGNEVESAENVRSRPFLRVCQINKKLAPGRLHARANLIKHRRPDVAHVCQHGPIDETN